MKQYIKRYDYLNDELPQSNGKPPEVIHIDEMEEGYLKDYFISSFEKMRSKIPKYYRLEFNEKQQKFHLDNYTHDPDTFGWFTLEEKAEDRFAGRFIEIMYKWMETSTQKFTSAYVFNCWELFKRAFNWGFLEGKEEKPIMGEIFSGSRN